MGKGDSARKAAAESGETDSESGTLECMYPHSEARTAFRHHRSCAGQRPHGSLGLDGEQGPVAPR